MKNNNGFIDTRWLVLGALALLFIIAIPFIKNKIAYKADSVATSKVTQISPTSSVLGETTSEDEPENRVNDIIENPDTYDNQIVDIEGIVDTIYGEDVFTIDGPGFMPVQNLLIVSTYIQPIENEDQIFKTGNRIRVQGTVRKMTEELKNSIVTTTVITDNLFSQYKGKPVVVATTIEKKNEE